MADTVVFIPAWNEEENIPSVLEELHTELPSVDVVVVDDGSTDGTAAAARAGGAEVVSFGENRGLTAGIAAGYAYAQEHGYRFCGRVDADGQHPPAELSGCSSSCRATGATSPSAPGSPRATATPSAATRRRTPAPSGTSCCGG